MKNDEKKIKKRIMIFLVWNFLFFIFQINISLLNIYNISNIIFLYSVTFSIYFKFLINFKININKINLNKKFKCQNLFINIKNLITIIIPITFLMQAYNSTNMKYSTLINLKIEGILLAINFIFIFLIFILFKMYSSILKMIDKFVFKKIIIIFFILFKYIKLKIQWFFYQVSIYFLNLMYILKKIIFVKLSIKINFLKTKIIKINKKSLWWLNI